MPSFLKKISFILLIFVSVSTALSVMSLWSLRQSSFYKPTFLVNDFQNNEFDYIILGASTGLTTLNSKAIDSILQTNGINLSMDDTGLSSHYLMLQHFLEQGKTTKFCVLAPSASSFDAENDNISDNDYRFLPYINTNYVSNYFEYYSSTPAKLIGNSDWLPLLGVSYFNAEIFYPSLLTFIKPKTRNRFDDRGNYTYPVVNSENKPILESEAFPIFFRNKYFQKIKTLCDANDIELICYFSPINGKKVEVESKKNNVINHSNLLKNTSYFYDVTHVNYKGRVVCSEYFAKDFKALRK